MQENNIVVDTVYFGGGVAIYANGKLHDFVRQQTGDYTALYNSLLQLSELGKIVNGEKLSAWEECIFWCTKYGKKFGDPYWLPPVLLTNVTQYLSTEHATSDTCIYCKE